LHALPELMLIRTTATAAEAYRDNYNYRGKANFVNQEPKKLNYTPGADSSAAILVQDSQLR